MTRGSKMGRLFDSKGVELGENRKLLEPNRKKITFYRERLG